MKILFVLILLVGLLGVKPARADFGLTASVVGLGFGVGLIVISPFFDKIDQDDVSNENEESEKEDEEFLNSNLSKVEFENLKSRAVGRRVE